MHESERSSQLLNLNTNFYKWEDPGRLNKYCMLLHNQKAMKHNAICCIRSVVDEGCILFSPQEIANKEVNCANVLSKSDKANCFERTFAIVH